MSRPDLCGFSHLVRSARKLLVVDFGFLGDTVQLVPVMWDLKAALPNTELHALTTPVGAEILKMVQCVERAWPVELRRDHRTLREQLATLRNLRQEQFDAAVNFSGADRTLFWTRLSGARHRATHTWGKAHFWTRWLIPHVVPQEDPNQAVAIQRQQVLQRLGFKTGPVRYELQAGSQADEWAAHAIPEHSVHLSVNAAKALKEWPLNHSIELARRLLAERSETHLVASGSPQRREQERLATLAREVNHPRLQLAPATLSLRQLAALLRRCRLHIGPDSGVMNLAVALGVPTISFFRDQPGHKAWVPCGPQHHAFIACCHCVDHGVAPCAANDRAECLASISVEQVLAQVRTSLGSAV